MSSLEEDRKFASVVRGSEIIRFKSEEIQTLYDMISRRIVYKTYQAKKKKKFEQLEESTIEKCFESVLDLIKYLTRCTRFATVEASFNLVEKVKELLTRALQSGKIMMLQLYLGLRTSRIKIKHTPSTHP